MERLRKWCDRMAEFEGPGMRSFLEREFGFIYRVSLFFIDFNNPFIYFIATMYLVPVTSFVLFCLGYTAFLQLDDVDSCVFTVHFFGIGLLGLFLYFYLLIRREDVCVPLNALGSGVYTYDEPPYPEIPGIMKDIKNEKYIMISAPVMVFFVLTFLVFGKDLDALIGYVSDVTYTDAGVNMMLVLPVYFPFPSHEGFLYIVAYVLQISAASFMAVTIGTCTYLYVVVSLEIILQIEFLNVSLRKMDLRADTLFKRRHMQAPTRKLRKTPEYRNCLDFCLGKNVEHHKEIMKIVDAYNALCGLPVLAAFGVGTLVIALSLVKLDDASNGFTAQDMTFVVSVLGEILHMYLVAYFGEKLGTVSEQLREEVYNLNWTSYHRKFTSSVVIFQDGVRKPLVLKAAGLVDCNMETFSSVINTAYSCFTMVNATK